MPSMLLWTAGNTDVGAGNAAGVKVANKRITADSTNVGMQRPTAVVAGAPGN